MKDIIQIRQENVKLKDISALDALLFTHKADSKQIVFTNGCFDLLHVGHVACLQKMKRLGDILVVGVSDDPSVKKLKGENRPVVKDVDRAYMLSALGCVDYVIIYNDEDLCDIILELQPHILAKGDGYTIKGVLGYDIVESYGGRTIIVSGLGECTSTTEIIAGIIRDFSTQ